MNQYGDTFRAVGADEEKRREERPARSSQAVHLAQPAKTDIVALSDRSPLKQNEEGRKAGTAPGRDGSPEAAPKSSFPSLASVPRTDLHHAPAISTAANTP